MSDNKHCPTSLVSLVKLAGRFPPRTRAKRIDEEFLEEAQNDAILAIRDRKSRYHHRWRDAPHSSRFATALEGVDVDNPGFAIRPISGVGPAANTPSEVEDVKFLRANTDRRIKITVPGPFTMTQQAQNDHYENYAS